LINNYLNKEHAVIPILSSLDLKEIICIPVNIWGKLIIAVVFGAAFFSFFLAFYFRKKWLEQLIKTNITSVKADQIEVENIIQKDQCTDSASDNTIPVEIESPSKTFIPFVVEMVVENQNKNSDVFTVKISLSETCADFSRDQIDIIGGKIIDLIKNENENSYILKIQINKGYSDKISVSIQENKLRCKQGSYNSKAYLEIFPIIQSSSKDPFDFLKAPTGESLAAKSFLQIRSNMNDIFKQASEKFTKGELGLIGAGHIFPRILKLSSFNEIGAVYCKSLDNFKDSDHWYFVGDIHGDFLAFHSVLEDIKKDPDFKLCFLGDLVDRGPYGAECFALLLKTVMEYPNRIVWILGNHDEVVKWDLGCPKDVFDKDIYEEFLKIRNNLPRFFSFVAPAEFLVWLNDRDPQVKQERLFAGNLFCDIVSVLPRCVLFPNGILATHAGFPLKDRWDSLKNLEDFHHQRCLDDFTWNRIQNNSDAFISKDMRPTEKSWTFGWDTIANFREKVKVFFDFKSMIRGHDHLKDGWELHKNFVKVPVLTLNTFGFHFMNNSFENSAYKTEIVYYKADNSGILDARNIIKIQIKVNLLEEFYGYKNTTQNTVSVIN